MPLDSSSPLPDWSALTDPDTGQLRSFAPSDELWAPRSVVIDGDCLCFDWQAGSNHRRPPRRLLERFLGIRSDEAILSFAERFGPLAPRGLYGAGQETDYGPPSSRDHWQQHRESLSAWRQYQSQLNALLTLVARVREKESPAKETFATLYKLGILPSERGNPPPILNEWENCSLTERLTTARNVSLHAIETYVRHCGLRPALTLQFTRLDSSMELVFQDARADFIGTGLSLFGALTVQVISAATGSTFAICSACGNFFVPRLRRPAFGRRRYCSTCGRRAALRDAKAAYRARLRAKDAARRRRK
jgi:hypothetical protein